FKKVSETIAALTADIGGDPTTGQKQLIERAALTAALIEDLETRWLGGKVAIDPTVHATLTNSLRRLLESIGLERVPKTVTSLNQYTADRTIEAEPAA